MRSVIRKVYDQHYLIAFYYYYVYLVYTSSLAPIRCNHQDDRAQYLSHFISYSLNV